MNRCLSCNKILEPEEAQRKYPNHEKIEKYLDKFVCLCNKCYDKSGLKAYHESLEEE